MLEPEEGEQGFCAEGIPMQGLPEWGPGAELKNRVRVRISHGRAAQHRVSEPKSMRRASMGEKRGSE